MLVADCVGQLLFTFTQTDISKQKQGSKQTKKHSVLKTQKKGDGLVKSGEKAHPCAT